MHAFHLRISFNFPDLSIALGRSTIYHPVILPTSLDAVTRAKKVTTPSAISSRTSRNSAQTAGAITLFALLTIIAGIL